MKQQPLPNTTPLDVETAEDAAFYELCCSLTGFVPDGVEFDPKGLWWTDIEDEKIIAMCEGRWSKDDVSRLWERGLAQACNFTRIRREKFLRRKREDQERWFYVFSGELRLCKALGIEPTDENILCFSNPGTVGRDKMAKVKHRRKCHEEISPILGAGETRKHASISREFDSIHDQNGWSKRYGGNLVVAHNWQELP